VFGLFIDNGNCGFVMKTIKENLFGFDFDLTVSGYNYGGRLNVGMDDITVEGEIDDNEISKIVEEVYFQIDLQDGEIYERLREQSEEYGYVELCVRGKY